MRFSTILAVLVCLVAFVLSLFTAPVEAKQAGAGQTVAKQPPGSSEKSGPAMAQPPSLQKNIQGTSLPLVIHGIVIKDSLVEVTLFASGALPQDFHQKAVLKIMAPGMLQPQIIIPLAQVDPGRLLSRAGGRIAYSLKTPLNQTGMVTATVVKGQWSTSKQVPLVPKMGHRSDRAPMSASMQARQAMPRPPSVRVDYPRDEIIYGSIMMVGWGVEGLEAGKEYNEAIILLKNGVELQRVGPFNFAGRSRSQNINMFGNLNGADYQVKVELYELAFHHDGTDNFDRILVNSQTTGNFSYVSQRGRASSDHPVVAHCPHGASGESYPAGSSVHLAWSCNPAWRTGTHPVRLTLVRDSTEGGGSWGIRDSINCAEYELDWIIPATVPPGAGYRIYIENLDGPGASTTAPPFSVSPAP